MSEQIQDEATPAAGDSTPVETAPVDQEQAPVETTDELPPSGEAESEAPSRERVPLEPNPHAEMNKGDAKGALTDKLKGKFSSYERVSLMGIPPEEFEQLLASMPDPEEVAKYQGGEEWLQSIDECKAYYLRGAAFMASLQKENSLWRQSVRYGAEELAAGRPRFGENTDPNNRLTGPLALLKMSAVMNLGATVQIPLWHSGIWVSIKAPSESELLELERRVAMEKVALGRYTNGLIFSNASIYTNSYLVNLALGKVYDATVKDFSLQALKELIKITDLPSLIWGLACTIWPQGYPFKQACAFGPTECTHVMEELLNLSKLSWTNHRALTEWQRKHMSNRVAKMSPESLVRYQEEHKFEDGHIFTLGEAGMSVELKVPTLADYELSGFDWVDSIVAQTDQAFGTTMTENERNEYIVNQGKATAMRQYSHWIQRMVLPNDQGVIDDPKTIEGAISALSSDGAMLEEFFNGVGRYIDTTTISLIALPRYDCPACGKDGSPEAKAHPHLVPLDVARVFFTLLGQRTFKVQSR